VTIPGGVPPQLLSDWRAAEERLYPVVMVRPDLYERAVRMVRVVTAQEVGQRGTGGYPSRPAAVAQEGEVGSRRCVLRGTGTHSSTP